MQYANVNVEVNVNARFMEFSQAHKSEVYEPSEVQAVVSRPLVR